MADVREPEEEEVVSILRQADQPLRGILCLVEEHSPFVANGHTGGIVQENHHCRGRTPSCDSRERSAQSRAGKGEHQSNDSKRPQQKKEQLPDPHPPHLRLLKFLQEFERTELHCPQLAKIQKVYDDRNGGRNEPEEHEGIEKGHIKKSTNSG
jgi:hypothetical protein